MRKLFLYLSSFLFIVSCQSDLDTTVPSSTLFTTLSPKETGIDFINQVEDGEQFNVLTYRNFYNGGGVAIGDINKDGLDDIYFTANMQPNKLYLNKGNWQFEDITAQAGVAGSAGWSTGVALADVNGDGWLDIYVCNSGDIEGDNKKNELFINNGQAEIGFTEQAAKYGLADEGFSTHASFFDYDLDGDLDCYLLNNSYKDPEKIEAFKQTRLEKDPFGGDKLFRNDGGNFTNVTDEAGIYNSPIGFGLGVSVSDLNGDMYPDIYISNDFWERDYLYLNNGDGTFQEDLPNRVSICSISSMGADVADLNNDGNYDIFTTDMLAGDNYRLKAMTMFDPYHLEDYKYRADYHYQILQNCLQINDGDAQFQEVAHLSGVSATDWSWGALIFDFDNDGQKDIYVCNGIFHEIMYLDFSNFINDKENIRKIVTEKGRFDWRDFADFMPSNPLANYAFVNQSNPSKLPVFNDQAKELGLGKPSFSNGAAYGDLDNDGDLDLVVNNVNQACSIFRNNTNEQTQNNYLKIKLEGNKENYYAVGAKVSLKYSDQTQSLQHYPQRGFQSSVAPHLLFGLGNTNTIDELEIIWPNLQKQVLKNIPTNQTIKLKQENQEGAFVADVSKQNETIFTDVTNASLKGNSLHQENRYSDFDYENLLPRMLSTDSPKIIKGDLNGDGLDDFVLTGADGDGDKLFLQKAGKWQEVKNWQAEEDQKLETSCGLIFDADGDGDNDLLLGAGGNEMQKGIEQFRLRYYDNDGKGNLTKRTDKTPPVAGMVSCIVPGDIDLDGDMDLFIGGRAVPGNYGLMPRSFLMLNEGQGRWVDVTRKELGNVGMVTDAHFNDTDQDGDQDLIIIGDWLPILHFENEYGRYTFSRKQTTQPYLGWWTCLEPADLDGDGDMDYVLGNWGKNIKFKTNPERPITMFVKDFDQNSKSEFVLNWYPPLDDEPWPFAGKLDMTKQVPELNKKALKFDDYAKLNYEHMFTPEQRQGAIQHQINYLETAILWNDGDSLRVSALPIEAQIAPAFGIVVEDMDADGHQDIWLGGNFYGLKPEVGRYDSSRGVFLKGDGKGDFQFIDATESGIHLKGEVKDASILNTSNKKMLLVSRNSAEAVLYEFETKK